MRQSTLLFLLVAFGLGCRAEDLENGKRLYLRNGCYECHGYAGNGSSQGRTRLAQTALSAAAFINFVRNPSPGDMPPYRANTMSDKELTDVYDYIKTFPASRPASEIPLLNEK
jgi:mono/diheme cytochrome c family protein